MVQGLVIDRRTDGPCGGVPGPGLLVEGTGSVGIGDSRIDGWASYAVADSGFGSPPGVNLSQSTIARGDGVAVKLRGSWTSRALLVAYNRLPADLGEPALLQSDGGLLDLQGSLFVGNRIDDVPALDAALLRGRGRIGGSAFLGNTLAEGTNLLQIGFDEWPQLGESPPHEPTSPHGLTELTLAQNRLTASPEAWSAPDGDLPRLTGAAGACWSALADGTLADLPLPEVPASAAGELIRIDSGFGQVEQAQITLARSFVVENGAAGGAVFVVRAPGADLSLQLLNNTFASNGFGSLMRFQSGDASGLHVLAARNPALEPGWSESPVAWEGPLSAFLVSQNHSEPARSWTEGPPSADAELAGPSQELAPLSLESETSLLALDDCELMQRACPGAPPEDCAAQESDPPYLCPVGPALRYMPAAAWAAANASPWPWSTAFFDDPPEGSIPGATGWRCGAGRFSHDRVPHPIDEGTLGDHDDYPTVFDCDNEDPSIFPVLPKHDRYSSEYCVEIVGECYRCPNGVNLPPESDDNDSAGVLDDDDSATPDPPADDVTFDPSEAAGCAVEGCGVSWPNGGGSASLSGLLALGLRRRRRGALPLPRPYDPQMPPGPPRE